METKQINKKRKKQIRIFYILSAIALAFVSSAIWFYMNSRVHWPEGYISYRGSFITGILYCIVYWFFAKMYQAHKIGVYRLTELTYFQLLAYGVSDIIMLVISVFWFREITVRQIGTGLIILAAQILVITVFIYSFNKVWSAYDQPLKTMIVYGEKGYETVVGKMKKLDYRYDIAECISDKTPLDEIERKIEQCDRVYLYKVEEELRKRLILFCNAEAKDIYISQGITDLITMGYDVSHAFDTPFIRTRRQPVKWYYPLVKRTFDVICSAAAIIILSPVYLITAAAIKLYDRGPVLYSQVRLTEGHREFRIYKFRSMITDAEKQGARLASQNDSRITPVGKVIRATRIDELPQLFNILKGDMSIVGPRPERPEIEAEYLKELPEFGLRLKVRAGLTGYAQVFGKYNTTPEDKLKLDLLYINQRSVTQDLKLMFYTVKILFIPESTEGVSEGQTTAMGDKNG